MKFPRVWQNKKDKKKTFRVMPWWECLDPVLSDEEIGVGLTEGRKFKIGAIVQVGWLLENEHGMWFGMGPKASSAFNDLGEWKKK
jgi:hypothetical protein